LSRPAREARCLDGLVRALLQFCELVAVLASETLLAGFAWPREAIPDAALAFGRLFPADSAIDGLVRINQLGASIWEVVHDWRILWGLALAYLVLAVISAFAVKRGRAHAQS
jgi:ABC-2 type transport system permease protein